MAKFVLAVKNHPMISTEYVKFLASGFPLAVRGCEKTGDSCNSGRNGGQVCSLGSQEGIGQGSKKKAPLAEQRQLTVASLFAGQF
jgi:hypothetical protein